MVLCSHLHTTQDHKVGEEGAITYAFTVLLQRALSCFISIYCRATDAKKLVWLCVLIEHSPHSLQSRALQHAAQVVILPTSHVAVSFRHHPGFAIPLGRQGSLFHQMEILV